MTEWLCLSIKIPMVPAIIPQNPKDYIFILQMTSMKICTLELTRTLEELMAILMLPHKFIIVLKIQMGQLLQVHLLFRGPMVLQDLLIHIKEQ